MSESFLLACAQRSRDTASEATSTSSASDVIVEPLHVPSWSLDRTPGWRTQEVTFLGVGDSRGMFEEWWFACHGCQHQWSITGSGRNRPKPGDNMQCMLTGEDMECPQCEQQALMQQVMQLTQEQIDQLPEEQRGQLMMLRQQVMSGQMQGV